MDRVASTKRDVLERMLFDESADPTDLPLSLLEYITNSFSEDKQIGRGGFSVVYKGILRNGTIAVKKLFDMHLHENEFHKEVACLIKAKHKNVVRFFGYCADTQGRMESYNGKLVMADVQQRLLCFEYLPKGSLHDYITDASHELEWTQYYQIIKGICTGLHYLHKNHIVHLDLKPSNILLDDNMVPKIADFGLSRCFDENQSHVITSKLSGSLGYIAPESFCGRIAFKSDIYSLGVIITEILTGEKMCPENYDVLERWGNRLEQLYREKQLEQLRVCAEIGKECTEYDPRRRPDARTIVRRLYEVDIADRSIVTKMRNLSIQQAEQHGDGRNLIGAIGRELSLKCLLRLSRWDYASVACLNRDFRSLVRNGEIYRLRQLTGTAEHWIYLSYKLLEWNAYDPDRRRWIQVAKMPVMDKSFRCVNKLSIAVGTDLLVFGVEGTLFSLFTYSILTNSWIRTDSMNHSRFQFGSISVGQKAYLAGGSDYYGRVLSSVEMYDSGRKDWGPLPSMNRARKLCSGVFMDGRLYVIGGRGSKFEDLTCGEEYDFERGSWRVIENMFKGFHTLLTGRLAPPHVAVVGNELYAADNCERNVKKYDKQNNTWITLGNLPESMSPVNGWGIGFKACGDQLIIIGRRGSSTDSMVELNSWVPDEKPPVWNLIARLPMGNNIVYNAAVMSC